MTLKHSCNKQSSEQDKQDTKCTVHLQLPKQVFDDTVVNLSLQFTVDFCFHL